MLTMRLALEALKPEDVFPVWCWIDEQQGQGVLSAEEALRWKVALFHQMREWDVTPDDLVPPLMDPTPVF